MSPRENVPVSPVRSLFEEVKRVCVRERFSKRTEEAYVGWIRRFVMFHGGGSPRGLGEAEVEEFLSSLATEARVAASTQNQALSALLFLYEKVYERPLDELAEWTRADRKKRVPEVLSREEVRRLLDRLEGTPHFMVSLLYGTGLRQIELLRLRVKDVDGPGGDHHGAWGEG